MSAYQRRKRDGAVQRWCPENGVFIDVAPDEPWTRVRKPNEGMLVIPVDEFLEPTPIDWIVQSPPMTYADLAKLHGVDVPDGIDGQMLVAKDTEVETYEQAVQKLKHPRTA